MKDGGFLGGIYGMAFIGAAVYYLQHAATFWAGVLGFFKRADIQVTGTSENIDHPPFLSS